MTNDHTTLTDLIFAVGLVHFITLFAMWISWSKISMTYAFDPALYIIKRSYNNFAIYLIFNMLVLMAAMAVCYNP